MTFGTIDQITYERWGHTDSNINNHVYLFGGYYNGYPKDLEKFDCQTGTLETVQTTGESPTGRSASSTTVIGSLLYVFGGYSDDKGYYNDLYSFNPVSQ
jgi:N-acetylneuraminic acid mutarotase